jgi:hypothetical protein
MHIALDSILTDERYYPRNEIAWREIQRYCHALNLEAEFPPIVVAKRDDRYVIIDGRHRFEAYRKLKKAKIPALITKLPEAQWFAEAVRLNCIHGHPLSYQERIRAAMVLARQKFSFEQIERIVSIQTQALKEAIKQRGHWVHPEDIRPVVLKAPVAQAALKHNREWLEAKAEHLENEQNNLSGQSFQALIRDLLTLLENDLIPDDDECFDLLIKLSNVLKEVLTQRDVKA